MMINDHLEIMSEKTFYFTPPFGDTIAKIILFDWKNQKMWRFVGHTKPKDSTTPERDKSNALYHAYKGLNRFVCEWEKIYAGQ